MDKFISSQHYNELLADRRRADLLQADLDKVDELHFDECAALHIEIAELKKELARIKLN